MQQGEIKQIIGPVVDVHFPGDLPKIYDALEIEHEGQKLILETQQHLTGNVVRSVALGPTDGLKRGTKVINTSQAIQVPVGKEILGRMFDVLGKPLDNQPEAKTSKTYPIHRPAPKLTDQSTSAEIFETGIKVIDLICPFVKGGKVGLFGGAGVGKKVMIQELI